MIIKIRLQLYMIVTKVFFIAGGFVLHDSDFIEIYGRRIDL